MSYYNLLNGFSHLESIFCRRDVQLRPHSVTKSGAEASVHRHASDHDKSNTGSGVQVNVTSPQREPLRLPPIVSSSSQVSPMANYVCT